MNTPMTAPYPLRMPRGLRHKLRVAAKKTHQSQALVGRLSLEIGLDRLLAALEKRQNQKRGGRSV